MSSSDPIIAGWRLAAHVALDPPAPDWRDALALRLQQRPRRIGLWAELALWGARQCLDVAGEASLAAGARLRVASLSGAQSATRASVGQLHTGSLMPFAFMQSQPGLMLAALGQVLDWQGDASFAVGRDAPALLRLALRGAGPEGLLFGWVEENGETLRSEWWRWLPA